jgi:hypothetical protein
MYATVNIDLFFGNDVDGITVPKDSKVLLNSSFAQNHKITETKHLNSFSWAWFEYKGYLGQVNISDLSNISL